MSKPFVSEFDAFAPYYDLEFAGFLDDLPLYEGYASGAGGPVLELACGTGRLLEPLATSGHRLTGVDISPAMLAKARDRLALAGVLDQVALHTDDMRVLSTLGTDRFRLAFCAINSFLHLPDLAAQRETLRSVRRHLDPGGRLILDLFHPHPDVLAGYDGRVVHEEVFQEPATGHRVDKFVCRTLSAAEQTIHTTFMYDRLDDAGKIHRDIAPFVLRYIHRHELTLLLDMAGFRIEDIHGDYALSPFESDSPQLIVVARPVA